MPHCLTLLAVASLLTAAGVVEVEANPLTLISCASGPYQDILATIRPGEVAAGVVMTDGAEARQRAEQVFATSMVEMITPTDANAVVVVTKPPVRDTRGDTTCVIFSGEPPLPPTTWATRGHR